jgi:hypothetical protein
VKLRYSVGRFIGMEKTAVTMAALVCSSHRKLSGKTCTTKTLRRITSNRGFVPGRRDAGVRHFAGQMNRRI